MFLSKHQPGDSQPGDTLTYWSVMIIPATVGVGSTPAHIRIEHIKGQLIANENIPYSMRDQDRMGYPTGKPMWKQWEQKSGEWTQTYWTNDELLQKGFADKRHFLSLTEAQEHFITLTIQENERHTQRLNLLQVAQDEIDKRGANESIRANSQR